MPYYAQLMGDTVAAVTETHAVLDASDDLVEIDGLHLGLLGAAYDRASGEFMAPEQGAPRHISVGALYDRFGPAKWGILADTSPLVQAVIKDASVRSYIDLDNPDLPAGLAILQSAGHTIDAASIVNAPIGPGERP